MSWMSAGSLRAFYVRYRADGWGRAAYAPVLMVKVLVYGYCSGRAQLAQAGARSANGCGLQLSGGQSAAEFPDAVGLPQRAAGGARQVIRQRAGAVSGGRLGAARAGGAGRSAPARQRGP